MAAKKHKGLTMKKAKTILNEGMVRGHKITLKQRRFFGAASRRGFKGGR